jgi:predicted permease
MISWLQDLRYAFRQLRKSPGFTTTAVSTLALAIGANAVVFGIVDALILRPINVPQAENLYGTEYGLDTGFESYLNYVDLRDRNHSFEDLAAFNFAFAGFDTGKEAFRASGFAATGNYFDVVKLRPYLGRFFNVSDEHGLNSTPYLVLSYAFWHSRFHDDPSVIGRRVQLNKHPFTIIGVAPRGFGGTLLFVSADFFMPIVNQEQVNGENILNVRGNTHGIFETFGHLKPGVSPAQAGADLRAVGAYLAKNYPKEFDQQSSTLGHVGLTSFDRAVHEFMLALTLLASLILLAACANLGSLFAARAADRSREVALRLALGSSRKRILGGLFTEAVLISLVGGMFGLWTSAVLLHRLSLWQPIPGTPVHIPVSPDPKLYLVAVGLSLLSAFLWGIVPVRQVLRANPYEIVKAGSLGKLGTRITMREVLLATQISICALLVTSSIVAVRGLILSVHANFGFEPRNTILVSTNLLMAGYSGDHIPTMQKRMVETMQAVPGVESVGLVNDFPPLVYASASNVNIYKEETTDLRLSNVAVAPYRYAVSPEYFHAAGTPLLAGRDFSWHDDKNAPDVAVVNRQFARNMFGSVAGALGRYCKTQDGTRVQIIGVVEDGKYLSLTENNQPAIFISFLRSPSSQSYLLVRSSRDPQQLSGILRKQMRELDPGLPADIDTWDNLLSTALFPARMATMALGVMGMMGAMLSITGIFGMSEYSVSKRLRELGIRVALGAQRGEILRAALARPIHLLALGSIAGLLLGILASRVLAFVVYAATPRDPLVLAGVVLCMSLLGVVATWIPARRALSVDPMVLLREE